MKAISKYFLLFALVSLLSCDADVATFSDDANRINFSTASTVTPYSFAYGPKDKISDTVLIDISTVGFISNSPRKVALMQLPFNDGRPEAVAGKHFLDFNDPGIAERYVIPAGKSSATFPIVIKRDPSLQTQEVTLRIGIKPNENFQQGFSTSQNKTITLSDFLSKPVDWNSTIVQYYGAYGKAKHQFMMDAVAPLGYIVDNNFMKELRGGDTFDAGLRGYWVGFMRTRLSELNTTRANQGLGPLREDPLPGQLEGTLVVIP